MEEGFEARTTTFPPTDDAYLQSGKGYNETLMRLEEGSRTSYLLFDLSPIEAIGGYITDASFQFTIMTDGGDGEIQVYQGLEGEWDETELDFDNAPGSDVLLGQINDTFIAGSTQEIVLSAADMIPGKTTLILFHANGNDLAIASKEHPSKAFPKLVVTYNAPEEADPITVADPTSGSAGEEEDTGSGSTENQAPQAVVNATPVNGQAPLEVSFEGKDSSDDTAIASYAWDFKDGSTSTSINPTHTYTEPGTYNASLLVTDGNGLTDEAIITITVQEGDNQAPVAQASASVTSGEAPLNVQFSANESTDDKGIVRYYWDFGTNDPSSAKNPSRTFTEAGEYSVTLTVTDAEGLTSTDNLTITVTGSSSTNNQSPVARISANPTSGPAPLTVSFDATASTDDSGIVSYSWDFGNTETGNGQTTQNTFNTPGTYTTTLTVTDDQGVTGTATISITVESSSGGGSSGGSGGGSAPPGYYVTPSGSAYASGLSESTAWSLEHAFDAAQPGDIVYVKAGNYGNKQIHVNRSGSYGNPIKFIGYTNTPGDIVTYGSSSFNYGEQLNASKMPLLRGSAPSGEGSGTGFYITGSYIHVENFQFTEYEFGLQSIGQYNEFKNIIAVKIGDYNPSHSYPSATSNAFLNYSGNGIWLAGNNVKLENSIVINAGAKGVTLKDGVGMSVSNVEVYADNNINPTDYYFLIAEGVRNSNFNNIYVKRVGQLEHRGHGITFKGNGQITGNTLNNFEIVNTQLGLQFPQTSNNTIRNGNILKESHIDSNSPEVGGMRLANGSNNNTLEDITLTNCSIKFQDWNDGAAGDVDDASDNNTFNRVTVRDAFSGIAFGYFQTANHASSADNNRFNNCRFINLDYLFEVDRANSNTVLSGCTIQGVNNFKIERIQGGPSYNLNASFQNCSWSNVGFTPPN
ncbi:PKD repeat-containing protein [Robiginitalea myxolifaciens]|uniref:PKD repeat-containing protein n=1 Tax=Robiginitalea myxolifaciens TaxID=400055 RepID=A0A1I6H213_9FLAO|nr:PKD domain-containing protein [Robiginitalea myxolifaciens]SFR48377.1 PKD repeat-containing protein [Robiginitalea myxolifaciens]